MKDDDKRLLVIDDDESYRDVLSRSLTRKGFVVFVAANAEDGLAMAAELEPEYILLDLNLAGRSGLNLVQPLIGASPGVRIVILTGYASIQTTVAAMKLGACQYLPKPANIADIVKALLQEEIDVPDVASEDRMTVHHLEWEYIQRTLDDHGGNIAATARALKMHRRTLQRKLNKKRPMNPAD